ncbi:site-specific DNA-methyltransferase [Alicyclobacillus herbarius]|uniref:site-specific DNA-methyltransferase n=1 Tax=Alicyclobacillus herbarius TaxID=122960 RepID=UPI0004141DE1|nr:site-specific DNA-methyltransferase [Alicyclobacillus herbarius]
MPTLQFKGKSFVQNHHLTVKYHELIPVPEKSLTDKVRLDDNLIIHGDNLIALKALLPIYAGKVKCIYIDPPYNTGTEHWVYNDNVNSPMIRDWLGKVVDREDLTRHDKWLCMMMPRLKLLRELLREDGAIFVSCDDHEQHRLRMIMDEIFGEDNFVATIIWQKKYASANDHKSIAPMHDFILVYQRSASFRRNLLPRTEKKDRQYRYEDERGVFRLSDYTCNKTAEERPNLYYPIINPNTGEEIWPSRTRVWAYSKEVHEQHVAQGLIYWGKDGRAKVPAFKRYKNELRGGGGIVPNTWWTFEIAGHTDGAKKEIRSILEEDGLDFITPKPTRLIERILQIATDKDSIVLDSFAGSGTTAHAVLALNKKDGGNRKFILVEMEEYADRITAERVRRVIRGVPGAKDEALREGLGGTFSYFELGQAIDPEGLLTGEHLPPYKELARYIFYTATGEEFRPEAVDESRWFIGESREYEVYLIYKPDVEALKSLALTLEFVQGLGTPKSKKRRLVFAPARFLSDKYMEEYQIEYAQLPYEMYRARG